ncbi:Hypothetical protein EMIHUDRAFT_431688 [Emiliania huxleyi CCMP1516]|uniref:Secreted protein n=2 Tax=Emiliania huxleyi TaxID=2903 RepID=A0A0D3L0H3_EMIH1|nr:Hypothetical protein EMIHUDRAFT_431688 [Emiliania huxleyi CCMP1516]EOD41508.1 Hypothetical protein EMIHUDRAFT_431688 [Emiliania huxleyi CCMP1516]|eukprot:XP_005793937.1 Hypothetical protein EMIHUDRAFT_431688 [Emiliania huxleyi CCMP1516]
MFRRSSQLSRFARPASRQLLSQPVPPSPWQHTGQTTDRHTWLLPNFFLCLMCGVHAYRHYSRGKTVPAAAVHHLLRVCVMELHERHHHGHSRWHNIQASLLQ